MPQAPKGPLVKLLEGFHTCTACIRLVEWRDRKSIVTLTRTTNPSISLALRPCMSEGRERCRLPQAPKGPLVKLLEGFHSPCTACIVWSSGAIVNLCNFDPHNQPINFSSPACPACQRAGRRCKAAPGTQGPSRSY
jgi:hypothetical protein